MNLVAKNLVIASILAAAAVSASTASALPVRDTEPGDNTPTTPPTRGGGVFHQPISTGDLGVTPVTFASKFQEPAAATQAAQTAGAVPETQSQANGAEEVEDLGDVDDAPEAHVAYGALRTAYPVAKAFTPVLGSVTPAAGPIFAAPIASRELSWRRTTGCGGTPQASYSKTWRLGDDFGNSKFGAGYEATFTLASTASSTANMDKLSGEAMGRAVGTLFGYHKDIARVTAKAALQGTQGTSSINVRVLGNDLVNKSVSGNLTESKTYNQSFFKVSQRIWLGPVPVSFTAEAKGSLGYSYAATYVAPYVNFTARPFANAYASVTAAVDVGFASAGVTGSLTLVELAVPGSAKLGIQPTYVTYDVDVDLTLKSLSGKVDAFAKVWYLFGSKKWTTTLAKWDGFSANYSLVDVAGCVAIPQ